MIEESGLAKHALEHDGMFSWFQRVRHLQMMRVAHPVPGVEPSK